MAARIRKDDIVEVIAGDHKGARGKVLRIDRERERLIVEGVNMVHRHVRRDRRNPQGGRVQKEAPIHLSNVMPIDPKNDRPTRVRFLTTLDSKGKVVSKDRVATGKRASGTVLSEITRAERKARGGAGR